MNKDADKTMNATIIYSTSDRSIVPWRREGSMMFVQYRSHSVFLFFSLPKEKNNFGSGRKQVVHENEKRSEREREREDPVGRRVKETP